MKTHLVNGTKKKWTRRSRAVLNIVKLVDFCAVGLYLGRRGLYITGKLFLHTHHNDTNNETDRRMRCE